MISRPSLASTQRANGLGPSLPGRGEDSDMKLSPIWQANERFMRAVIDGTMTDQEKFEAIASTELFAVNSDSRQEAEFSASYWLNALREDDIPIAAHLLTIGEAECYPSQFVHQNVYGDKPITLDLLKKTMTACLAGVGHDTVLEIGAGFGQVARLMLLGGLCKRYVIIDIPESLWMAKYFLEQSLGEKVFLAQCAADVNEEAKVMLIPHYLAQHFTRPVDSFINTSSLGEMDNTASSFYLDLVQSKEVNAKKCVLLNRLMNTYRPSRENFRENEAGWYFALDDHWKWDRWELEPDFTRNPYETQMHHREVLLIGNRHHETIVTERQPAIELERWWTHRTTNPASRLASQLSPNNDTARYLFERVRTTRSAESIDMLLTWLHSFCRKYPFEEEAWLCAEYKRITGRTHPTARGIFSKAINTATTTAARTLHRLMK